MKGGSPARRTVLHVCTSSEFISVLKPTLRYQAARGLRVHVVCAAGSELEQLGHEGGVFCHSVRIERSTSPIHDAQALRELVRLMWRIRPDVTHAHNPKGGMLGMVAATIAGASRRIYQIHGLRYEGTLGATRIVLRAAEKSSCSLAHHVLTVGTSIREKLLSDRIVDAAKCSVIESGSAGGIDVSFYSPDGWRAAGRVLRRGLHIREDQLCVGFAGRLASSKGLSDLQDAWPALRLTNPHCHLLIAGDDDATDPVDLRALRGTSRVHFLGRVEDLRPFYAACDVLALPSLQEGFPQVALEAAAMAVPVVATAVTGTVDAVEDHRTGLLVEPHAPDALAAKLSMLLDSASLRNELGVAARRRAVQRFSPGPIHAGLLSLYEELLLPGN